MHRHQLHFDRRVTRLGAMALAGLFLACGGGDKAAAGGAGDTASAGAGAAPPAATTDTPPAGGAAAPAGSGGGGGGGNAAQIALGDSIFHGQAGGGTCYACHGQDGKGSGVGPNLTDSEWLNTDGSLEGLVKTITTGVPQPKKAPAPMPPMGGAQLSAEQIRAVAAYEYSLSHK